MYSVGECILTYDNKIHVIKEIKGLSEYIYYLLDNGMYVLPIQIKKRIGNQLSLF